MALLLGIGVPLGEAFAVVGRLKPQDFNRMYYLASIGKVGVLRNAVNRGLNIDSLNAEGDTGLCIAVKRKNYVAYNTFRMSGANPKHSCTYRIHKEYQEFLSSTQTVREERILGNAESLYYNEEEREWLPWILGGAVVGGGAILMSGGGGSSKTPLVVEEKEDIITPIERGIGLGGYISNHYDLVEGKNVSNLYDITLDNKDVVNVQNYKMIPNVLDVSDYLRVYTKVNGGGEFVNRGKLSLGNATVGIAVYEEKSVGSNLGTIDIKSENATIGMVASNGAEAFNGESVGGDDAFINMSFKGASEGNALIGMYADTDSGITNYGKIVGTTSEAVVVPEEDKGLVDEFVDNIVTDEEGNVVEGEEEEEEKEEEKTPNAGTMVGMGVFNFYTGTNLSDNTVKAENYGDINLSAGYNAGRKGAVSLVGMGSYLDDKFLNQNNNPSYAEKMELNNKGNIKLSYQGEFEVAEDALKLGDGGLVGMRADASTVAKNEGNIDINLTSTTLKSGVDVAAGMISVHGAELYNGNKDKVYDGIGQAQGVIKIMNDATSGGVSYGMLASKGDGSQTRVYNWKDPKLYNYGLIDMQVSNSYAMTSFDGGDVVNYGVINLGVENGHSYYTGNYGLYSEGKDITDAADLVNKGIINVNSTLSVAMQQMFSGAVDMINDGVIYISQKATGSKAFAGNFSKAVNNNLIRYKVDNSENFSYPEDKDPPHTGWNFVKDPVAAVVSVSTQEGVSKQEFVNNGVMIIGDAKSDNYNGTFGTSGVEVSGQGSAINSEYEVDEKGNEKGLIWLKGADSTYKHLNVGLYLGASAKRAAFVDNKGKIVVDANNSIGILNKSSSNATAFNNGDIYVNGKEAYGMAGDAGAYISNGMSDNNKANIYLNGVGSVGMYIKGAEAFNFGSIYLQADRTTAYVLEGTGKLLQDGNVFYTEGNIEQVFYEAINGANISFARPDGMDVDGFVFAKASRGATVVSVESQFDVESEYGRLFIADGEGAKAILMDTQVNVQDKATAVEVRNGGTAELHQNTDLFVSGEGAKGVSVVGDVLSDVSSTLNLKGLSSIEVNDNGLGVEGKSKSNINAAGYIKVNKGVGIKSLGNGAAVNLDTTSKVDVFEGSGVEADDVINEGRINVMSSKLCNGVMCGLDNYVKGMVVNTQGDNMGTISGSGMAYSNMGVLVKSGASFKNSGSISSNNIGVYVASNGYYEAAGGLGISENYIGIYNDGGELNTAGNINDNSYGVYQKGGYARVSGTLSGNTYGIYALGGRVETDADITVGDKIGAYVKNAKMLNYGEITVGSGEGVRVSSNGNFTNEKSGYIIADEGTCIYVENGGYALNNGTLELVEYEDSDGNSIVKGKHVVVESGGTFENTGKLLPTGLGRVDYMISGAGLSSEAEFDSVVLKEGATFINKGVVNAGGKIVDFDDISKDGGEVIIGKNGSFEGGSFSGNVIAGADIVKDGFLDVYENKNSFVGEDKGVNVSSQSYMFDAKTKNEDGNISVELNRKDFGDIVKDKKLAEFFEVNYAMKNNEKMYNSLKSAMNKKEFELNVESESGKKFYGVLARENMAVIRNVARNEKNRILDDGLKDVSLGAQYFRTGKGESDNLTGFEADVYSAYLGRGFRVNNNLSYGFNLLGAYVDSQYEDVDSQKENKIVMAFAPLLYKNGSFKYLGMANFGVGFGEYDRNAISGKYSGDSFDVYYGVSNAFEYSVDAKVAEIVAEAELNFMGISSDDVKEKGGFVLKGGDSHSLEAGIGLKIRKNIELAKERSLMLEIGSAYYHEFLDPYKNVEIGARNNSKVFDAGKYNEDKDRIRTTARALYKDSDLSVGAEISHNIEKESNIEGGVGVRYSF